MNINELKQNTYAPYSATENEWCVVQGESGIWYPGVRIENIAFPLTISAIHGALSSCIGNGDQPKTIYQEPPESELTEYWREQYDLNRADKLSEQAEFYDPLMPDNIDADATLKELIQNAVTPHSGFPVSAMLLTGKGYIPGVNVELTSWSLGLCAERLAIFRAVTAGYKSFRQLKIYAPKGDFSSPCGACRQVLMEWMPNSQVELNHGNGSLSRHKIQHLLPHAFSSNQLKKQK